MFYTTEVQKLAVYHGQVHQMTLWGHQVHLCMRALRTYGVPLHKCLEISTTGTNSLYNAIFIYIFFLNKTP